MMKSILCISLMLTFFETISAQNVSHICFLENGLSETSGLIFINGRLITHNDSGSEAELYEVDTLTGQISRRVVIENASNFDWESICTDGTDIYIGDFGNNFGIRTNLRIFKLSVADYFNTSNDTVSVDTIHFYYADQVDFTSSQYNTNYDAEAFLSRGDSLYLFTKNWLNNWTNVYSLSKEPGDQIANRIDSLNVEGLISGGGG